MRVHFLGWLRLPYQHLLRCCPNLKKMHELKEEFRKIYETSENPTEGLLSISEWLAKSSSVFTKSCQKIRNWFGEIISYFERRTTNGVVEGINNKLKLIKRRADGFRNFRNFWVRSMLSWHLVCWFSIKGNEEPSGVVIFRQWFEKLFYEFWEIRHQGKLPIVRGNKLSRFYL